MHISRARAGNQKTQKMQSNATPTLNTPTLNVPGNEPYRQGPFNVPGLIADLEALKDSTNKVLYQELLQKWIYGHSFGIEVERNHEEIR